METQRVCVCVRVCVSKANMHSFSLSTSQLVSKSVVHIIQARLSLSVCLVRVEACVCDTSVHLYTPKQLHKKGLTV